MATPPEPRQPHRAPARRVDLQPFRPADLPALVDFWNVAFAPRRNFRPLTAAEFRSRVLDCPAHEDGGLILAWEQVGSRLELAGLAHAFRPAPAQGLYLAWPRKHELALLYVRPESRRMGVGTRLLHAAERWLYYCPVYVASVGQPCYGGVEGPRAPFFGSSEHMAISARETSFLHFLSRRGYAPFEPGSISMSLALREQHYPAVPLPAAASRKGLRPVRISHTSPFGGREPDDRLHYLLLRDNGGAPYDALGLEDQSGTLVAHLTWFPLPAANHRRAAITNVRVAPELRGDGLGSWLLDQSLHLMQNS
ncbi:MAG: GNAT family N-acetyltransferase, partial [Caldilineaceae bacterium]